MTNPITPTDLNLYELLGDGRAKFEPDGGGYDFEELLDEPTIVGLHKLICNQHKKFEQGNDYLEISMVNLFTFRVIPYNSSLSLLDQQSSQ